MKNEERKIILVTLSAIVATLISLAASAQATDYNCSGVMRDSSMRIGFALHLDGYNSNVSGMSTDGHDHIDSVSINKDGIRISGQNSEFEFIVNVPQKSSSKTKIEGVSLILTGPSFGTATGTFSCDRSRL